MSRTSMIGYIILTVLIFSTELKADSFTYSWSVQAGKYSIAEDSAGDSIEMEGFSNMNVPGYPSLPVKRFLICLPPGAHPHSAEITGDKPKVISGTYNVKPAPQVIPRSDFSLNPDQHLEMQKLWDKNHRSAYYSQKLFPEKLGSMEASGSYRKYRYAMVSFTPFQYAPETGELIFHQTAEITIHYSLPEKDSFEWQHFESLKTDIIGKETAARLFENFDSIGPEYASGAVSSKQNHNYVIITTAALAPAITASDFVAWKNSLGFDVRIVLCSDPEITSQPGTDLAEQIRNFLRNHYATWGIEYVLLVGDYATVPMRYCYPDPSNHSKFTGDPGKTGGEVPTDHYYADLSDPDSVSWDLDGDGFHGEWGEDAPDFLAEVQVGRIPVNDATRIKYTLNKTVVFEKDTGAWKDSALHAGAFYYYTNEDHSGAEADDGSTCPYYLEINVMQGWNISHYSEQGALEQSEYPWTALTEAAFTDDWRTGAYGVVNEGAHGLSSCVARKLWISDDGDGVPETSEITWDNFLDVSSDLDDDYPSIFTAMSCLVGYPEPSPSGNLGIDLLTEPGWGACVAVVSSSRIVYGPFNWDPLNGGGCESICYEFNRFMIDGPSGTLPVGNAFFDGKFYTHTNFSFGNYIEHINMLEYNLFGDPSLRREGVNPAHTPVPTPSPAPSPTAAPPMQTITTDNFESGVYSCEGPLGATNCSTQWSQYDPTEIAFPPACEGTYTAWHSYEACNSPHGPDHLLIINGNRNPNINISQFQNIQICLDWYYNNNFYGETFEIWISNADFSSLDCTDLSDPWELLFTETDSILYNAGSCNEMCFSLPDEYDMNNNLVVGIRYTGYDADSIAIDNVSVRGRIFSPILPSVTPWGIIVLFILLSCGIKLYSQKNE